MSAWNREDMSNDGTLLLLGLFWSAIVGIIGGLLIPFLRRYKVSSEADTFPRSDVAGTPWEKDPSHISHPPKSGIKRAERVVAPNRSLAPTLNPTSSDRGPEDW